MRDPFAPAAKSVLAALGKDALLRGVSAGKVNVEYGVDTYGDDGAVVSRDIATILSTYAPKRGDLLELVGASGVVEKSFKLGELVKDTGYSKRYIVLPWS
jgi:hypothetical protein